MENKSHSLNHKPSVNEVNNQPLFNPNGLQSKDDMPPPPTLPLPQQPRITINLCFVNEDMRTIRRKYKVMNPPHVIQPEYYKNLGFVNGYDTLMFVSDKKARVTGKSLHALARSWFKEGVRKQDKGVSNEFQEEKCHRTDNEESEEYFDEVVEAEVAEILAGMSTIEAKTVEEKVLSTPSCVGMMTRSKAKPVEKKVLSTFAPCTKKRTYAPKRRRLNDIPRESDQK